MEKRVTKKEIVKMLLKNNELDAQDEEEQEGDHRRGIQQLLQGKVL